jgi:hypothetical protein
MVAPLVHNYNRSRSLGDWAEEKAAEWYRKSNHIVGTSLKSDPFFQVLDIDMVVQEIMALPIGPGVGTDPYYVEVKGDGHTGVPHVFIETLSNVERNSPGCLTYTCADVIFYYHTRMGTALIIDRRRLQEWMPGNLERFPLKTLQNGRAGIVKYTTQGRLVPAQVIIDEVGAEVVEGLPVLENSTN